MSKPTSEILQILHSSQFQISGKMEAELRRLVLTAENPRALPSVRVQARIKLTTLYHEIARLSGRRRGRPRQ